MKMKNLNDLFMNELRDIYHAEKQLLRALPHSIPAQMGVDDHRTRASQK